MMTALPTPDLILDSHMLLLLSTLAIIPFARAASLRASNPSRLLNQGALAVTCLGRHHRDRQVLKTGFIHSSMMATLSAKLDRLQLRSNGAGASGKSRRRIVPLAVYHPRALTFSEQGQEILPRTHHSLSKECSHVDSTRNNLPNGTRHLVFAFHTLLRGP